METATKTIASFEALTPELFVPQGTPETGLGLPASLNAQFSDGVAGEIPVTWQCAAGYDPNAAAGGQFAFAAVLPEGYALSEGVSLPQILVTLTPPLANAMLAAESDEDWTLSDGKLTVTGNMVTVDSGEIPPDIWNAVTSIEVTGDAYFILAVGMSFSGSVMVENGAFYNFGDLSGDVTVLEGESLFNQSAGKISGGVISGWVENTATISGGKFTGTITGGGAIAGGDFSGANLSGFTGTATSGTFAKFELSCDEEGNVTLTTTSAIDLTSDSDDIAPITLADVDALVISKGTAFFGGDTVVTCPVTLYGTIEGGDFRQAEVTVGESATIHRGKFAILECDVNGAVTVTGAIDLDNMEENEARLWNAISAGMGELFIAGQASFDAGDDPLSVSAIRNFGKLTGGTFENNTIENHGEITGGTFNESVGNFSSITGGTFNGTVTNLETGSVIHGGTFLYRITGIGAIAGGDFTRADVTDVHGAITGGTFEGGLELENGRLHITEKNGLVQRRARHFGQADL